VQQMAGSWPKFIRDSVHGLIRFDEKNFDQLLLALVDCREFQRLRRIKQLGFAHFVFPAATHTRFSHSLGVMWNARQFVDRLRQLDTTLVDEAQEAVIVVGALLHDLGHGPFSHAFEKVTDVKHERRTVEILLDPTTEIRDVLSKYSPVGDLPRRVASLFAEGMDLVEEAGGEEEFPRHLADVVSSQLDADRFDYLIRDSQCCGIEYGRFDFIWLLSHLFFDSEKRRFYLSRKAHHAAEQYVFARHHMYQSVYFHKTIRAAEVMLRQLMGRIKNLLGDSGCPPGIDRFPPHLERVLQGDGSLDDFLLLDDDALLEFIKSCVRAEDKTLACLANGLIDRRLYKCVDMTDLSANDPSALGRFNREVGQYLESQRETLPVEQDCAFVDDTPEDTPYKIYDPDSENPATQIYIELDTGEMAELSRTSGIVSALKEKVALLRYYFPEEIRDDVKKVAREFVREDRK